MLKTVLIVALCLIGIFIHPFDPGVIDFIYRFIVFVAIVYLVYDAFRRSEEDRDLSPTLPNVSVRPLVNDPVKISDHWQLASFVDNDERTLHYLVDQFDILASLLFPDNGWICYRDGSELSVLHYRFFSDHVVGEVAHKYPISGLIQILDEKDTVVLENNLDKSESLIPFYRGGEYHAASFIGLPVKLHDKDKLFFIFDSAKSEQFNKEDIVLFSKLLDGISNWISNRTKAVSLYSELNRANKFLNFATHLNSSKSIGTAIDRLCELLSKEFEASRLTVSLRKRNEEKAIIKKVIGQKDEFDESFEFNFDEGLTGWVISKNKPYLIEDMEKGEYFIPRYTKTEKTNFGLRSFLGVPLASGDYTFGALTLEHRMANKYTDSDKQKIRAIMDIFSSTFLRTSTAPPTS